MTRRGPLVLVLLGLVGGLLSACQFQAPGGVITCQVPWGQSMPTQQTVTDPLGGPGGAPIVGWNNDFGQIGTAFDLINPGVPDTPINILEDRSTAGSGWQTGYWFTDPGTGNIFVMNQEAGNSVGSQWGYGHPTDQGGWIPDPSDHYHPGGRFSNPQVGTSPNPGACGGQQSVLLDDAQTHYAVSHTDPQGGYVYRVSNTYELRSLFNQTWPTWAIGQTLQLSRQIAHDGGLRLYLSGPGWQSGPVSLFNGEGAAFDVTGVPSQYLDTSCGPYLCAYGIGDLSDIELDYTNIMGAPVVVDMKLSPNDPITWLTNWISTSPGYWGGIAVGSYQQVTNNGFTQNIAGSQETPGGYTAAKGAVRSFNFDYYVGTPTALESDGFALPSAGGAPAAGAPSTPPSPAAFQEIAAVTKGHP